MRNLVVGLLAAALTMSTSALAAGGNGMPSGEHYNLNIIGTKDKSGVRNDSSGHVIFVPLARNTKILCVPGTDFDVTDANGTDGVASYTMPLNVASAWTVWVRALGKPGQGAEMETCYTDDTGDWCYGDEIYIGRDKGGKPRATNVSAELLYVTVCVARDLAGACIDFDTIPIFSDATLGYFWSYDNNGQRLAQLRFYPKD